MKEKRNYQTRQKDLILGYICAISGHTTVNEIAAYLEKTGNRIGVTTIYRHLDQLIQDGKVRKFHVGAGSAACFQYIEESGCCHQHYHLKCEGCGKLIHLECGAVSELERHISEEHEFVINSVKTSFYGLCKECAAQKSTAGK